MSEELDLDLVAACLVNHVSRGDLTFEDEDAEMRNAVGKVLSKGAELLAALPNNVFCHLLPHVLVSANDPLGPMTESELPKVSCRSFRWNNRWVLNDPKYSAAFAFGCCKWSFEFNGSSISQQFDRFALALKGTPITFFYIYGSWDYVDQPIIRDPGAIDLYRDFTKPLHFAAISVHLKDPLRALVDSIQFHHSARSFSGVCTSVQPLADLPELMPGGGSWLTVVQRF